MNSSVAPASLAQKALATVALGQHAEALALIEEASEAAKRTPDPVAWIGVKHTHAVVLAAAGRREEARGVLDEARVLAQQMRPDLLAALEATEQQLRRMGR